MYALHHRHTRYTFTYCFVLFFQIQREQTSSECSRRHTARSYWAHCGFMSVRSRNLNHQPLQPAVLRYCLAACMEIQGQPDCYTDNLRSAGRRVLRYRTSYGLASYYPTKKHVKSRFAGGFLKYCVNNRINSNENGFKNQKFPQQIVFLHTILGEFCYSTCFMCSIWSDCVDAALNPALT